MPDTVVTLLPTARTPGSKPRRHELGPNCSTRSPPKWPSPSLPAASTSYSAPIPMTSASGGADRRLDRCAALVLAPGPATAVLGSSQPVSRPLVRPCAPRRHPKPQRPGAALATRRPAKGGRPRGAAGARARPLRSSDHRRAGGGRRTATARGARPRASLDPRRQRQPAGAGRQLRLGAAAAAARADARPGLRRHLRRARRARPRALPRRARRARDRGVRHRPGAAGGAGAARCSRRRSTSRRSSPSASTTSHGW